MRDPASRTPATLPRAAQRRRRGRRLSTLAAAGALVFLLPSAVGFANDTDLFRTNVAPNVLLVVDNSKSMTNTVWHSDYGFKDASEFEWKNQTSCTHFRDAFTAAGVTGTQKFKLYPGGRRVKYTDPTGWDVRTRKQNNKSWEPAVIDGAGTHVWNDVDGDGVRDTSDPLEWLAYYKTCDPSDDSDYVDICEAIIDHDGDGNPGVYVRDADGDVIYDAGTGRPLIYKSDPGNPSGLSIGGGAKVNVRTTITPREVAFAAGIDPETYAFTTSDICGIDPTGWSLFVGESTAETPHGSTIQFLAKYLDFLFSSPYGDKARPAVFTPTLANDGIRSKSPCIDLGVGEPATYETYRRTRLMALRLVLRTVTCELDEDVRFGLAQFRFHGKPGDDNGGYVALPVESMRDENGDPIEYTLHGIYDSHADHMARVISKVGPDAQTPLAETLFQVYTFFMSRTAADLPPGRDADGNEVTGVSFPVYEYNMDLHNPLPDEGGDLNMVGGHYVGSDVSTTHPKPATASNLDADGLDPNDDGGEAPFPAWDPNPAPDPIQYACQKNFVLLITDGGSHGDRFDDVDDLVNANFEPPSDIESGTDRGYADFESLIGDHFRNPDGSPDEEEMPVDSKVSRYMDDIAYFMSRWDFRPDLDGDQTIDTYTVGYSVDSGEVSNVEKTAINGNGLFFESADADKLSADIIAALTDIIEKAQSFTSATVPASRTTDGNNFYSSYFRPKDDTPYWDGHLKNFEFTAAGDILTEGGTCAVGSDISATPPCPTSGTLRTSAKGFWDAADEIPAPASRNLYAGKGDTNFTAQAKPWSMSEIDRDDLWLSTWESYSGVEATLEGPPYDMTEHDDNGEQDDLTEKIVSSLAGCEFPTVLGVDCVMRTNEDTSKSMLGDIFHSNPVVVGSPNAPLNDPTYQAFAVAKRTRKRIIYAGSNGGFLHGFLAGVWRTLEDDGITPVVPPRHDRGTGEELMAFMPSSVRQRVWQLPGSQQPGTVRSYTTVDGSPAVGDAWLYRQVLGNGRLGSLLSPPLSTVKQEGQWRTVLLGGLRDGGLGYFALDVTDPASSDYPGYLWEFPCDDCSNAVNGNTLSDELDWIGFSWSEPVIARVRVAVEGDATPGGHDRWVAIFGAGYHQYGNPNHVGYVDVGADWSEGDSVAPFLDPLNGNIHPYQGRAIYMVDLTTGKVLAKKRFKETVAAGDNVHDTRLEYAFASQPAVFDLDFDGYADLVLIGDLGGNLWKWVVTAVGDDPINNTTADADPGQPDWPFKLFFQAEHSDAPGAPSYGSSHFQSFFFPPTGTLRQSRLVLALGAGERAAPEAGVLDGDDSNNNHYYVLRDIDPLERGSSPQATIEEDDLVDNADLNAGTYTCEEIAGGKGYFLTSRDREKFITNSVIFLGEVLTGSFLPAPPGSDPCSDTGTSFLYRFGLKCGDGAYTGNPGTEDDKRRKAVGGGMPTRPRVSVGGLNQGGGGGGCENKVVVITSDGGIENECPGPLPSSGVNVRSWRER